MKQTVYQIVNRDCEMINVYKIFNDVYRCLEVNYKPTDKTRLRPVLDAKKIAVKIAIEVINHKKQWGRKFGFSFLSRMLELENHTGSLYLYNSANALLLTDKSFQEKYQKCDWILQRYLKIKEMVVLPCNPSKLEFKIAS